MTLHRKVLLVTRESVSTFARADTRQTDERVRSPVPDHEPGGVQLEPADVWFFPYLAGLRDRQEIGEWTLIPVQLLAPEDCLAGPLYGYVEGLARLYERPSGAGVFVRPPAGSSAIGSITLTSGCFGARSASALWLGTPLETIDDAHSNLGHTIVTSDSTVLYGHPFSPDGGVPTVRGALVRRRDIGIRIDDDTMAIQAPLELPHALLRVLRSKNDREDERDQVDHDRDEHEHEDNHADDLDDDEGEFAGRVLRAADWLDVLWRNTESITGDTRILAVHAGLEALVAPEVSQARSRSSGAISEHCSMPRTPRGNRAATSP